MFNANNKFKVVETFSGIGSQAKALKRAGIPYEILRTVEWDINAMIAYDIIHNGKPDLEEYENMSKEELLDKLNGYTLSTDGKKAATIKALKMLSKETLMHICHAIKYCNNLVSINDVNEEHLPEDIDLLTYSFPCQDLSIAHAWFGESGGIDRNANNRSSLLWQIERILIERFKKQKKLPKFLLMENVSNICSNTHKENFNEWKSILENMGYLNEVYLLDASKFGIPQKRTRVYMVSVLCKNEAMKHEISNYLFNNNLELYENLNCVKIENLLRLSEEEKYRNEAIENQLNDTESRRKIVNESNKIFDGEKITNKYALTITTKQDRLPNSGLIKFKSGLKGKLDYRYLTPRECFMLMGFEEGDYQVLIDNNFNVKSNKDFFTKEKLHRMAGNSIVVNVLVEIFNMIYDINNLNFQEINENKTEIKRAI